MNDSKSRIPAAGGVLLRGSEVLVITEISTNSEYLKYAGELSVPLGHIEPGEECAKAAEREFLEETGISVRAIHLLGCYSVGIGDAWMFLMEKKEKQEGKDPKELLNPQWISIETLLNAKGVRSPTKEVVRNAVKFRESRLLVKR